MNKSNSDYKYFKLRVACPVRSMFGISRGANEVDDSSDYKESNSVAVSSPMVGSSCGANEGDDSSRGSLNDDVFCPMVGSSYVANEADDSSRSSTMFGSSCGANEGDNSSRGSRNAIQMMI